MIAASFSTPPKMIKAKSKNEEVLQTDDKLLGRMIYWTIVFGEAHDGTSSTPRGATAPSGRSRRTLLF